MMVFETAECLRSLHIFETKRYNCIRFDSRDNSITLKTHQLRKLPIAGPFVRFRTVVISRFLGESTLKFLRDAKESFTGSKIYYSMTDILNNNDMRNQMHYLLQNVFHKISYISVDGSCLRLSDIKVLTDGLPNCSRIKINFRGIGTMSDECTFRMLLNWLSSGKSVAPSSQTDTLQKHLTLACFPRRFILDLVQHIKDAFNDENLLFSDFVITFIYSSENTICLEGNHKFTMNKMSSNERLSFFIYNHFSDSDDDSGLTYRLWCRRVVNEYEDLKMALHLQNLEEWSTLGIDLYDREFYHFNSPCECDYDLF